MKKFLILLTIVAACSSEPVPKDVEGGSLEERSLNEIKAQGNKIAQESFKALSSQLSAKIKEGGIIEALSYCNLNAYPLTDSLSRANNVHIKRTSLKLRNTANTPDSLERVALVGYQNDLDEGIEIQPYVLEDEYAYRYFAPIKIMPKCLNCHGDPDRFIAKQDLEMIKELYPEDEATHYSSGDLRGIWSIRFSKDEAE